MSANAVISSPSQSATVAGSIPADALDSAARRPGDGTLRHPARYRLQRAAQRRTLAQWTAIAYAAAVAVGAIIGRTSLASGQSVAEGAVALLTLLAAHRLLMFARFERLFAKLVDHRVRVLVAHGKLRRSQLWICGLTENDVLAKLRQSGVRQLEELRYVLYETKG